MNHIKKRKMFNSIFISVSVLLIAFFASCDNFFEITYESESQELYTLSGKLLSPFGSYENKNARYAIPDFSSANIVYSVEATNESGNTVKGIFENGTTNFSIKLGLGKWTLKATGTVDGNNAVLEGTKEIELTTENPLVSGVSIELLEVYSGGGTGTVKLKLKVPSHVKLIEANWTLKSSPQTAYIAYFKVNIDTVTIDTYDTNGTKDFKSGAYELSLYFWSESDKNNKGTLLYYISSEIVNVFSGMETTTWEGNAEYFSENNGNKTVVITEDKIQNFLHTTFYVGKKYDLQHEAKDTNPGTYFYPLATVKKAIEKIQETEKVQHYDSYSIYVYKSEPNDSPTVSENVNITIYGEENSVSGFTMSATGGTLTANTLSVTGNLSVTSGNATFSGGSGKGGDVLVSGGTLNLSLASGNLKNVSVSNGTATLTGAIIIETANVTGGNLTLTNATVNGTTTVSENGNLSLDNASAKNVNANGGTLTATNNSSMDSLSVSNATTNLTSTTISGAINLSNGNLTLSSATANGDITYTGGTLTLEGSTTVANGKKIILSQNRTISVKNLSEPKVAEIEDSSADKKWSGWTNEAKILTSESGNMSDDIISKFTLNDSNKIRVLKVGTDNKSAVLGFRTTFYVSANGNDSDGSSEQSAFKTVAQAINKIKTAEGISHNSSYIINVSGSVTGPVDFSQSFTANMPNVLLVGKKNTSDTITATNSQVIKMPTLTSGSFLLSVSGLTLSGGSQSQEGSIMSIPQNTTVNLTNCTITGNTVGQKGAVYVSGGSLILGGTNNITGNKTSSNPSQVANVYLANGRTITLNTAGTAANPSFNAGSKIGVTTDKKPTSSSPVQITNANGNSFASSFSSDEGYTVAQQEAGATAGLYLKVSGGSFDIDKPKNVEFKLSPTSVDSNNLKITVIATVDGNDITRDLSSWSLKIYFSGVDTGISSKTNTIDVDSAWPAGKYQLYVSASDAKYTYGGTLDFEKK